MCSLFSVHSLLNSGISDVAHRTLARIHSQEAHELFAFLWASFLLMLQFILALLTKSCERVHGRSIFVANLCAMETLDIISVAVRAAGHAEEEKREFFHLFGACFFPNLFRISYLYEIQLRQMRGRETEIRMAEGQRNGWHRRCTYHSTTSFFRFSRWM